MQQLSLSTEQLRVWNENEYSRDQIIQDLKSNNIDDDQINEILKEYKKIKLEKRQLSGFIITTIGGLLCFISCIFTLLNIIPSLREFVLYGLTTIGIVIILVGLYLIFED